MGDKEIIFEINSIRINNVDNEDINVYQLIYNSGFDSKFNSEFLSTNYMNYIAKNLINKILNYPELELLRDKIEISFDDKELQELANQKPVCFGSEYINYEWLKIILNKIIEVFKEELKNFSGTVDLYFTQKNNTLIVPSRLYFHLVENPQGDKPFAFMVTYTSKEEDKINHFPLSNAINQYGINSKEFRNLTSSLFSISNEDTFIKNLIDSGEIFVPISLTHEEAYTFLKRVEFYQKKGIVCRIPNWWSSKKDSTTLLYDMKEIIKENSWGYLGGNVFYYVPKMEYNGIILTPSEIKELLTMTNGLAYFKGKWIEVDNSKLEKLLETYEDLKEDGTTIPEILKLSSNVKKVKNDINIEVKNNDWQKNIKEIIEEAKDKSNKLNMDYEIKGNLREYQLDGYRWIHTMLAMNLGVCLADDMGLGKTIQIIAYLTNYKKYINKRVLLIVPSTIMYNWENELKKFAPNIDYYMINKMKFDINKMLNSFLIITTYQIAINSSALYDVDWGIVILDEAQAIKNWQTTTAKKIKSLKRDKSIAITGTPIENTLLNLWSLFDFINPGLLGSKTEFTDNFNIKSSSYENVNKIKNIISPFILRRLKTDKTIIKDLPEKIEHDIFIDLSKKQIILYNDVVNNIDYNKIKMQSEFEQKRILLTIILNLKQICNHPSQYLGDEDYKIEDSGKFIVLKELCEKFYNKKEKVLVFTQFKEITSSLNTLLKDVYLKEGFIITGDTSMAKRKEILEKFQTSDNVPYLILSLKTAGVGLNLTNATNVVHFDRWWNPAVENQATDRTFRIGQTKNVNVYKFICKHTLEEPISQLLFAKSTLSTSVLDNIDNNILSKMSVDELYNSMKYTGDLND